jgi:hypothetical protein
MTIHFRKTESSSLAGIDARLVPRLEEPWT